MDPTIAGPAPTCPESPEIAVPIAAKIPAPMTAPMPSAVSWRGPSERLSPPPTSLSAMHWSTVLRLKSCALDKQRCQHQRDRAQQLDEHVQRRPRRVFEIGRAHAELQSPCNLVCRLLLEKKKKKKRQRATTRHNKCNNQTTNIPTS